MKYKINPSPSLSLSLTLPGMPHTANSSALQPNDAVGFAVGCGVVGLSVGGGVGGDVGALVSHESAVRSPSTEVRPPNAVAR